MPLILVDTSHLMYRHHYTKKHFSFNGFPTGGIFGVMQTYLKLLEQFPGSPIVSVFDSRSDHRHQMVTEAIGAGVLPEKHEYKGGRDRTSSEYNRVLQQMDRLLEFLPSTCIQPVKVPGHESDDVIGSYSAQGPCVIVSGDRDFHQLLSEEVQILDPKGNLLSVETIHEKYGLEPHQMIDIGALEGDTSDNIPGVPGIGKKTAPKLVSRYHSVENLLENLSDLPSKTAENLRQNADLLLLSKKLKAIHRDVEVPQVVANQGVEEEVRHFIIEEMGFRSMVNKISLFVG